MKSVGFVNYEQEWWHYDLGDCIWSEKMDIDWYFDGAESLVRDYRLVHA